MTNDVKRCYGMIVASGFGDLDSCAVINFIMESHSQPAILAMMAWFNLTKGRLDRVRTYLSKAEILCGSDEDLAYLLHIGSMAYLRMDDLREALDKERRCLSSCRKTKDVYLAAQVLVHVGALWSALRKTA